MKKLLFPILSLVLLLTACYDKDIQEINNRLDNIENQKIASISEQIEAIQKTLPLLSEIDEQLSEHIASLEDTSNKEITALKEVNATLRNQIADLEKYVNDQLSNTTNWANATFATLAQYNSMVKEISGITLLMNNTKAELLAVISQVETSMKSWVNEQLTGYYDIAEINAKLEAIDKQIKAGDEENAKALNELKEQLEKSKTELTEAYQKAITEAISNNNGVIDGKIASQIEAVNKRIDSEVDAMNTKIAALEARIKAIEDKLDEILNRKLEITFDVDNNIIVAPNYTLEIGYSVTSSTNSATVEVTSSADIKAKVVTNGLNGKISITTGDTIDEYSKVIVFVSNGENVIMRSITFEEAIISIDEDTELCITVPAEGGEFNIEFLSNTEYEVLIGDDASDWLSVVPSTRGMEKRDVTLKATPNEGPKRYTMIHIQPIQMGMSIEFDIYQESKMMDINYTTNDGKPLALNTTDGFGDVLLDNIYNVNTGKGILRFQGQITTIPNNAFKNCKNLVSIEIPSSITRIGESAFQECSNITKISIPNNVKIITKDAFYGCYNLHSIYLPNSISTIESNAFRNCSRLDNIYYDGDISSWCKISFNDDSANPLNNNAKLYLKNVEMEEITIPTDIVTIKKYSFIGCDSLKSITIGNNVTSIEEGAFQTCNNLKNVYYTGNLSEWCKINFVSNPLANGARLYISNQEITKITTTANISSLKNTFNGCTSLTSVTISNNLTTIGEHAFSNCSNLLSVTISNSVTTIESYAFSGCNRLANITYISPNLSYIAAGAFSGCKNLQEVRIPNSVRYIGQGAFSGGTTKKIYCMSNTPSSGYGYMFGGELSNLKIYVPRGAIDAYKTAKYWDYYTDCIVGYDF